MRRPHDSRALRGPPDHGPVLPAAAAADVATRRARDVARLVALCACVAHGASIADASRPSASADALDLPVEIRANALALAPFLDQLFELGGVRHELSPAIEGIVSGSWTGTLGEVLDQTADDYGLDVRFDGDVARVLPGDPDPGVDEDGRPREVDDIPGFETF